MKRDSKQYRSLGVKFFLAYTVIVLLMISACVTRTDCPPQPDWISSPEQEAYFVGVGSADTGNQAEDRPVAEGRARADLASRISVQISSEMMVETEDRSDGEYEQQVRELVQQSVEENIQDIETVDTYYCRDMGTWVYVRLSKAKWERIQNERRAEILRRIKDLLDPVLLDSGSSFAVRIERLGRSYELVDESSFAGGLIGEVGGETGNVNDLITSRLHAHVGGLEVLLEGERISAEVAETLSITGRLVSADTESIGVLQMELLDDEGRVMSTGQTDQSGEFELQIPDGFSRPGEVLLTVRPAFRLSESLQRMINRNEIPAADITAVIQRVSAGLVVDLKNSRAGRALTDEVQALFSDRELPLRFVPGEQLKGYNLRITIWVEDYPRVIENAPFMSRSWAVASLEKNGVSLYSYECQAVKDGGISIEQAHSRVLDKLLGEMQKDTGLFEKLKAALNET